MLSLLAILSHKVSPHPQSFSLNLPLYQHSAPKLTKTPTIMLFFLPLLTIAISTLAAAGPLPLPLSNALKIRVPFSVSLTSFPVPPSKSELTNRPLCRKSGRGSSLSEQFKPGSGSGAIHTKDHQGLAALSKRGWWSDHYHDFMCHTDIVFDGICSCPGYDC